MNDLVILDCLTKGNVVKFLLGKKENCKPECYTEECHIKKEYVVTTTEIAFPFDAEVVDLRPFKPIDPTDIKKFLDREMPLLVVGPSQEIGPCKTFLELISKIKERPSTRYYYIGDYLSPKVTFILSISNVSNVDYAHFLAFHEGKCKQIHGHGSCKFSVKIEGWQDDKWVVDFGVVKRIVKEVVEEIDHKFLVSNEYVKVKDTSCIIEYETVNGKHYLELPLSEVKIVNFDPTLENILRWMSSKIMDRLPLNVEKITLVAQEGMGGTAEFTLERKVKNEI